MKNRRVWILAAAILIAAVVAWRWFGRTPTQAEEQDRAERSAGTITAAVVTVERMSVTREFKQEADLALELAQSRYNLGLSSMVEFSPAELQKTEADVSDTAARYQFESTRRTLKYATGILK